MKKKSLFILGSGNFEKIYGPGEQTAVRELTDVYSEPLTSADVQSDYTILKDCEIIFSGWGGPRIDETFLAAAPNVKAVFYGAGSIKGIVSDAFWNRDIIITSSWVANAVPVAEYTLSQIVFSLKKGWQHIRQIQENKRYSGKMDVPGAFGSTVAIISLGVIGRMVCEHLRHFDLDVIAYDPFVSPEDAESLGVRLCSLEACFQQGDVVSLHAPWLPETEKMIRRDHFASMKKDATFINTARGAIVDESGMIEVLQTRNDLMALLDVTYPEPPVAGSPLYDMPNVVLTPHIAGSMGKECRRMGQYAVAECRRYLAGEPLKWQITREKFARMA
jgi:phosphoglycerate dehydrogenase-like enzyme